MSFVYLFGQDLPAAHKPGEELTVEVCVCDETIRLFVGEHCVEIDRETGDKFFESFEAAMARRYRPEKEK